MIFENIISELALIFAGAAIFATLFLYFKQPIILAYILLGMIAGPWGARVITDADHIEQLSQVGIILLLFLIGLNLRPDRLYQLLGKTTFVTLVTCVVFLGLSMTIPLLFGFPLTDSLITGAALMFSSTIISLKLIPTTKLHHKHIGEMMVSVLLLQDILAIILILLIGSGQADHIPTTVLLLMIKLVFLTVAAFYFVKYAIVVLLRKFDTIREYSFLLALGWGLLIAGVGNLFGLSYEMGAFIAGVSLATVPVALVIAEDLKPLRDFFLVLFFFSIGANFNFLVSQYVLLTGLLLAIMLIIIKPLIFRWGFQMIGEKEHLSRELGIRLGQGSEFSLLVAHSALTAGFIEAKTSYLIQTVVILTFVISTYWVIFKYPTPISSKASQRQD